MHCSISQFNMTSRAKMPLSCDSSQPNPTKNNNAMYLHNVMFLAIKIDAYFIFFDTVFCGDVGLSPFSHDCLVTFGKIAILQCSWPSPTDEHLGCFHVFMIIDGP